MVKARGRRASKSGRHNEDLFACLLDAAGYEYVEDNPVAGQYCRQSKFSHPWGKRGKQDAFLVTHYGVRVLVQNKNQNGSGTVDEKLPFQFDIARWTLYDMQFDEFWLVLGGTWWREPHGERVIEALKRKAEETDAMVQGRMKSRVLIHPSSVLTKLIRGDR